MNPAALAGITAAIVGAVAAAIIVAAYFLTRHKPAETVIPFLETYWQRKDANASARRVRLELRHIVSMLLVTALAGLLAFSLVGWERRPETGPKKIFVLDRSASMSAHTDGISGFEAAKASIADEIDKLQRGEEAMLVGFGAASVALTNFSSDRLLLEHALQSATLTSEGSDDTALKLLLARLQKEHPSATVRVFSDRVQRKRNAVGITAFAARAYPHDPSRFHAQLSVRNFSRSKQMVNVSVRAGTDVLQRKRMTLAANTDETMNWDGPAVSGGLIATLNVERDPWPADNTRHACPPLMTSTRVSFASESRYVLAALSALAPQIELDNKRADVSVELIDANATANAVELPSVRFFHGNEAPAPYPERIDDLFEDLGLRDLNIGGYRSLEVGDEDRVLAEGKARGRWKPLIIERRKSDRILGYDVAFAPSASDLPLRETFPLLLDRMISELHAVSDARTHVELGSGRSPDWSTSPSSPGVVIEQHDGHTRCAAYNVAGKESIQELPIEFEQRTAHALVTHVIRYWWWILLVIMALLAIERGLFERRRTE